MPRLAAATCLPFRPTPDALAESHVVGESLPVTGHQHCRQRGVDGIPKAWPWGHRAKTRVLSSAPRCARGPLTCASRAAAQRMSWASCCSRAALRASTATSTSWGALPAPSSSTAAPASMRMGACNVQPPVITRQLPTTDKPPTTTTVNQPPVPNHHQPPTTHNHNSEQANTAIQFSSVPLVYVRWPLCKPSRCCDALSCIGCLLREVTVLHSLPASTGAS
jgi:hypothetical protein